MNSNLVNFYLRCMLCCSISIKHVLKHPIHAFHAFSGMTCEPFFYSKKHFLKNGFRSHSILK